MKLLAARVGATALLILTVIQVVRERDILGVGSVAFPIVGLVILWMRPTNRIGWILTWIGSGGALGLLADFIPSAPTASAEFGYVLGKLGAGSAHMALVPYLILLFPSGSLPSRRWRLPARLGAIAIIGVTVVEVLRSDSGPQANPVQIPALQPVLAAVFAPFTLALVALGVAALVNAFWRLKKATGDEREQLRWFAFSTAVFPVIMLVNGFAMGKSWQGYVLVAGFTVGLAAIAGGIGVAVIKYRLYAIDIVINKTVIFGAMAAFVTFVYVAVVAGIGSVLRSSGDSNLPLSLAATAIVAVAFQPIRARVTAVANRLVYGQRLSPYEAVASFARRVSESFSPQDVLPEMAEAAARSVGATRSRVRLFLPTGDERTFWWPDGSEDNPDVQFDRVLPVVHHGEHIGEVAVAKGRGEQITKHDEVLLADVTTEAALAMRSLRLTDELEERLIELQESRRRIVSAQDEERRRMERDIHDGAQQQLIAIKIKIALAKALVHDDLAAGCALLDDIAQESSEAIETLRDLARGLFPDILVDRGLVAAVQRHVTKSGIDAEVVAADGESRFDLETEANVYFVIREALQNAGKYAPTAKLRIDVSAVNGSLDFKVSDDGPGFDPLLAKLGRGSQNMRDRLEALGGTLHVVSAPGAGTQILGSVPRRDPSDEC